MRVLELGLLLLGISDLTGGTLCDPYGGSFFYNESLQFPRRRRVLSLSGCPNHFNLCQQANCGGDSITLAQVFNSTLEFPLLPHMATNNTYILSAETVVGVALNGVLIQGQPTGKSGVSPPVDVCGGSAGTNGRYHYSLLPTCLLLQLNFSWARHSPQVGWALDGFPIYGPVGFKGVRMLRCGVSGAHPIVCLDECNGFYGELRNVDAYLYRYYLPGEPGDGRCSSSTANLGPCPRDDHPCCLNILPPAEYSPLSISCFKGCPLNNFSCVNTNSKGVTSAFYPSVAAFPTEIYNVDLSPGTPAPVNASVNATTAPSVTPTNGSSPIPLEVPRTTALVRLAINDSLVLVSSSNSESPTIEVLPSSSKDAYIAGIAVNSLQSRLYFTTEYGVFFTGLSGSGLSCAISGYVPIAILGFNFNVSSSIPVVTVGSKNPQLCSNVVVISDFEIQCLLILQYNRYRNTHFIDYQSSLSDALDVVTLQTLSGSVSSNLQVFNNISSDPQPFSIDDVISNSRRPVISSAIAGNISGSAGYQAPFRPYAIAVTSNTSGGVYFSDFARKSIFAIDFDKTSDLYTILSNVSKIYSIAVVPISRLLASSVSALDKIYDTSSALTGDIIFYLDPVRGIIAYTVPQCARDCISFKCDRGETVILYGLNRVKSLTSEGPASSGSNLLFVLFQNGLVFRIDIDMYFREQPLNATQSYGSYQVSNLTWLTSFTVFGATTKSRFTDVFMVPAQGYVAPSSPFSSASNNEEIMRRMLVSNSNEEQVLTPLRSNSCPQYLQTDQQGLRLCSSLRGNVIIDHINDGIMYPVTLSGYAVGSDGLYNYSKLFVGEYLGKIWSFTLRRRALQFISPFSFADINIELMNASNLIIDLSEFSSSLLVRNKRVSFSPPGTAFVINANGVREERPVPSENNIFYEVTD